MWRRMMDSMMWQWAVHMLVCVAVLAGLLGVQGSRSGTVSNSISIPPGHWYIRLFNVDAHETAAVNGSEVADAGWGHDSGWIEITPFLRSGDNELRFRDWNDYGGYAYGFQLRHEQDVVWTAQDGRYGVVGANDNEQTAHNALVYDETVVIHPDGTIATDAYVRAVLADHPISYWPLNDPAGSAKAHDEMGRNPGTITGGVTLGQDGLVPGSAAMSFDGKTGYIDLSGDTTLQPPNALTVEAWVQTTPSSFQAEIFRSRHYGYGLDTRTGGVPEFYVCLPSGCPYGAVGKTPINDGRLHHLVGTKDAVSVNLYVDGALVASVPDPNPIYYQEPGIAIGRGGNCNCDYFQGTIDDVAVYDHALTAAQVRAHYQAAQSGNSLTACTLSDLNWSAWCSVSAREGLVLHDVTLGPRYLAQKMSVGYLNVVFQPAGGDLIARHIALAPHATERAADGSFIAMSVLTQPPTIALMPGTCGYQLCKPDYKCPNGWCSPAAVILKADYRIYLDEQQSTWLDVEQRYQFYQEFNEETNKNYVPCEPADVVLGVSRFPLKHLLGCARFKPIVEYWFHSQSRATLWSVRVAQRLHFTPDRRTIQAAMLAYDCDQGTNDHLGAVCHRHPLQGPLLPGVALYNNERALSHEVVQWAVLNDDSSNKPGDWDNLHLTWKNEVDLPLPPPGCPECVHMHWRWGHGATKGPTPGALDLSHVFGDNHPLIGYDKNKAWPTANPTSNQDVEVALVSYHAGEDTPTDFHGLIQGLRHGAGGYADGSGTESLVDPVLWVSSTGYQDHDVFFAFGGFFCSTCGPNNLH